MSSLDQSSTPTDSLAINSSFILPLIYHYHTNYHVCAVGRVLCVGAAIIWKEGHRVLNPPGGSWEEPVVNCSRRANSSWVKLDTTAQNHFITCKQTSDILSTGLPVVWRKHTENSHGLPSLWNAMILRQSQHGPWSPARLYYRCHTSTAGKMERLKIPQWRFKGHHFYLVIYLFLIINITHTSNSFSSNMASRFSGTSSFKPAIYQEITLIICTLPEFLNERSCSCASSLTFEEMFHLISYLAGQSVLGQQVEIMHFVFIGNSNLSPAWYQLHHLQENMWQKINMRTETV